MKATVFLIHALYVICIFLSLYRTENRQTHRTGQWRSSQLSRKQKIAGSTSPIADEETIRPVFAKIKQSAEFLFGFIPRLPIELILATPAELRKLQKPAKEPLSPMFSHSQFEADGVKIYLRRGLSKEKLFVALAHEYAHVWQNQEGFRGGSPERIEGFAEWFAYKLAEMEGYNVDRLFLSTPCSHVSTGLRKFLTIESLYGFYGAIKAGKSNNLNLGILR